MADRFWVGGSGNWDATSTTNWSDTSGGAGGASAPTLDDDVYFNVNSNTGTGAFTITVTGTSASPAVCRDFTASGLDGAMTLTMPNTSTLDIYSSFTLPATNFSVSATTTATITFRATTTGKTITTNGVSLGSADIVFNGAGGEWTLGSAYTSARNITITAGSFVSANYNLTFNSFATTGTTTKSASFGSSTITLSGTTPINLVSVTGFTLTAGTSAIICSNANPTFAGGGLTYNNVSFTSTASGTTSITGSNTFNNLTYTSLAATGIRNNAINGNQTINGTLTLGTANTPIRRMFMRSAGIGTPVTLTANTVATLADVDFRDIVGAGTGTWSGTRLGNCGGNSNITFNAGKTVYRVGTGNWSATQWSLSSGGSVDVNNFPLAQDTALFDTGTTTGTHTIDAGWNIGTLNMSALNVAVTLATGTTAPTIYSNVTLDSDITLTGTGALTFSGASNQTLTSAGDTFTQALTINKPAGTSLIFGDNVTTTSATAFTLTQGTLDLNTDKTLTCVSFSNNNSNTRSIAFGTSGKIVATGTSGNVWSSANVAGFTYTGTSNVELNSTLGVGTRNIIHGTTGGGSETTAISFNVVSGTDTVNLALDANKSHILNLNFTGFSGTTATLYQNHYGNLTLSSAMTNSTSASLSMQIVGTGTQVFTMNGKSNDCPIIKSGTGTLQLADNLTIGSTRTFTHTAGTLDLNARTLTSGLWSTTGSTARSINFNGGTIVNLGNWTASGSNLTTTGTGTINMTSASSKTFAGGGFTYSCTLNQGGLGTLVITGANTFANMANTVQPVTITFPASTVTSVQDFNVSGTAGNLVTLNSSTTGTQWTIAKV
jgi:hypothetical protein